MIHDTLRGGQHDVTELTAGKQVAGPHLDLVDLNIEAGRDATALVQATNEVDDNLSRAMIVHNGNVTNVAYSLPQQRSITLLLHALQELQEHLGARAHQHLTLTALLSVGNGLEGVSENVHQHGDSTTAVSIALSHSEESIMHSHLQVFTEG